MSVRKGYFVLLRQTRSACRIALYSATPLASASGIAAAASAAAAATGCDCRVAGPPIALRRPLCIATATATVSSRSSFSCGERACCGSNLSSLRHSHCSSGSTQTIISSISKSTSGRGSSSSSSSSSSSGSSSSSSSRTRIRVGSMAASVASASATANAATHASANGSTVVGVGGKADGIAATPTKQVAQRLAPFGTTVFTQISALAVQHGAVNLGQGFPNFDGPSFVVEAAAAALREGHNQYARMAGLPELTVAVARRFERDTGVRVADPDAEVTVTSRCTEAIAATALGLVDPGDEVVLFEPFYDSYVATLAMAGAVLRVVTLRPPRFDVPEVELRAAFVPLTSGARTRAIFVNTPHNPTGKVFSRRELELIAELCKERDTIAVSDEVYHRMVYPHGVSAARSHATPASPADSNGNDGCEARGGGSGKGATGADGAVVQGPEEDEGEEEVQHISIASLPGMYSRTVTLNSLGKTYSLTGWKVGWAVAPPHLTWGLRQAHSFFTFSVPTPLQHGAVAALNAPDAFYEELLQQYSRRRDVLVRGLRDVGLTVFEPQGTYFVMADHTAFGYGSDVDFCRHLIEHVGVAAIPPSSFYHNVEEGRSLVRFAFCKDEATLEEAVRRLKSHLRPKGQ